MFKKILAITFAVMFLSSVLSVGGHMTPASAMGPPPAMGPNNNNSHLPYLSSTIPFGTAKVGVPFGNVGYIAVNDDNHRVYAATGPLSANRTIDVIDGKTLTSIANVTVGFNADWIVVDKKTNRIYVANYGDNKGFTIRDPPGSISVIDGKTNQVIDTIDFGHSLCSIAVNEKTNRIYASTCLTNTMYVIDGKTNQVIDTIQVPNTGNAYVNEKYDKIYGLSYGSILRNGTFYYDSTLNVFDGKTDKLITSFIVDGGANYAAVNQKTGNFYSSAENDGTLFEVDGKTNQVLADNQITAPNGDTRGVAVNERLNEVYVVQTDNSTLAVVDGKTDQPIDHIPFGTPTNNCVAAGTCHPFTFADLGTFPVYVAADDNLGQIYVPGGFNGNLYVFDTNTHQMMGEMHMGPPPPNNNPPGPHGPMGMH